MYVHVQGTFLYKHIFIYIYIYYTYTLTKGRRFLYIYIYIYTISYKKSQKLQACASLLARVPCAGPCASCLRELLARGPRVDIDIDIDIKGFVYVWCRMHKGCARAARGRYLLARALREPCASSCELIYV